MSRPSPAVTKLPKWAQWHIQKLEADVKYYRQQAEEAASADWGKTDTGIRCFDAGGYPARRGLPKGTEVVFKVNVSLDPDRPEVEGFISVRVEAGRLYVNASGDALAVVPGAANALYIEGRRWV